jgi:VCBS repeat protein
MFTPHSYSRALRAVGSTEKAVFNARLKRMIGPTAEGGTSTQGPPEGGGLLRPSYLVRLNGEWGRRRTSPPRTFSCTVSMLLGNGDGTLGQKRDYGTGYQPERLAMGDFNGDGRQDLAVVNYGSNTVAVLVGVPHPIPLLPRGFRILSSQPNPSRDGTELRFLLSSPNMVVGQLFDILGTGFGVLPRSLGWSRASTFFAGTAAMTRAMSCPQGCEFLGKFPGGFQCPGDGG